jgi:hypothetical protein
VLAAAFADVSQIPVDLAVTVNAAALQLKLLDEPGQPFVLSLPCRTRLLALRIVAAGMHVQ